LNTASLPKARRIAKAARERLNGPGYWWGTIPVGNAPHPPPGQAVVYFLTDSTGLLYIGSSGKFAERIRAHRRTKLFTHWAAIPMATRKIAYQVESALIAQHRPPLNGC
jgi:hypothetical protein